MQQGQDYILNAKLKVIGLSNASVNPTPAQVEAALESQNLSINQIMTKMEQGEEDEVDALINLVKSVAEVAPTLIAPHIDLITKLLTQTPLTENSTYLACLIIHYTVSNRASCALLFTSQKEASVIGAACWLMAFDDTSSAQKGFNIFKDLVAHCPPEQITGHSEQLSQLLMAGLSSKVSTTVHETITMLRYFELACHLSSISEAIFVQITQAPIQHVFTHYFQLDMLTQMAMLDFMPLFTKLAWTAQVVAPFLKAVFEMQADLVEPNLVLLAACVHAETPSQFDVLSPNYLQFLERTLKTKPETGCSCFWFLGKCKQTMQDMLRKPEGIALFKLYLSLHAECKSSFLAAMEQILAPADVKYSEMVRRIFSNVLTASNFPQPGLESKTLDWLLDLMRVPFEEDEIHGLKVFEQLCGWDWGIRLLFTNINLVKYLTERVGVQSSTLLNLKYEIVTKAIQFPQQQGGAQLIPTEVMQQLTEYKLGGVFGENIKHKAVPVVDSMLA